MTTFKLNDRPVSVNIAEDTPLLWVIRDEIGLKGPDAVLRALNTKS
jgi:isoquinoline 1-oxidoreductase subunit alpha